MCIGYTVRCTGYTISVHNKQSCTGYTIMRTWYTGSVHGILGVQDTLVVQDTLEVDRFHCKVYRIHWKVYMIQFKVYKLHFGCTRYIINVQGTMHCNVRLTVKKFSVYYILLSIQYQENCRTNNIFTWPGP